MWFGHTEPYGQKNLLRTGGSKDDPVCTNSTNKQTEEVSSSPGLLLTSRPLGADKEPPRAGKLHLPGPGTEEVSHSQTSDRATSARLATPQEARLKTPLGSNFGKVIIIDYSLKLDDKIGVALKAPIQELEPLIEELETVAPDASSACKVIFFDIGEVPCCDSSKVLGKVIIFGFGGDGLDSLDAPNLARGKQATGAQQTHRSWSATVTPRTPLY